MCSLKNRFTLVLLCFMLTHCMTVGERKVTMNAAQIQQKLNRKIEKPLTVMKMFHVQLSNAQVSLEPGAGRIHTLMDASVRSDLFAKVATGKLGVSGLLKFDAGRQAVVLDQPSVDLFQLDDANAEWNGVVQQLAKDLGGKWLNQLVLYEVKPEELTFAGRHYVPGDLEVTAEGLQVTLKPQ